jgi:hypothetical protein
MARVNTKRVETRVLSLTPNFDSLSILTKFSLPVGCSLKFRPNRRYPQPPKRACLTMNVHLHSQVLIIYRKIIDFTRVTSHIASDMLSRPLPLPNGSSAARKPPVALMMTCPAFKLMWMQEHQTPMGAPRSRLQLYPVGQRISSGSPTRGSSSV